MDKEHQEISRFQCWDETTDTKDQINWHWKLLATPESKAGLAHILKIWDIWARLTYLILSVGGMFLQLILIKLTADTWNLEGSDRWSIPRGNAALTCPLFTVWLLVWDYLSGISMRAYPIWVNSSQRKIAGSVIDILKFQALFCRPSVVQLSSQLSLG